MNKVRLWTARPHLFGADLLPGTTCKSFSDEVLLTYDDGPGKISTPVILKELNKKKWKAVFFCTGKQLEENTTLAREIVAEGHILGNHLYSHKRVGELTRDELREEIEKTELLIEKIQGKSYRIVRPPYGSLSFALLNLIRGKKYRLILWSLLTYDWEKDPDLFKFVVWHLLKNRSIVVLHDKDGLLPFLADYLDVIAEKAATDGLSFGDPVKCLNL